MDFVDAERTVSLRVVAPIIGGLVFIVATGFLQIRSEAVQHGLLIGWDNSPTAVAEPGSPWLQQLAIGVLCALATYAVWPRSASSRGATTVLPAIVLAATLIVVSGWFLVATTYPYLGPVRSAFGPAGGPTTLHTPSGDSALLQWARAGALDPATHALAGVAVGVAILAIVRGRRTRATAT